MIFLGQLSKCHFNVNLLGDANWGLTAIYCSLKILLFKARSASLGLSGMGLPPDQSDKPEIEEGLSDTGPI